MIQGAIINWDGGAATGNWGDNNNWSNNSAWASANTANFDTDLAAGQYSITLGAARTVAGITFSSGAVAGQGFTFNAGSVLTVNGGGITNSDNDTQTFNNAVTLGAAQTWSGASGALNFNGAVSNSTFLLTLSGTGTANSVSGVIGGGSGGITKTGTSTWTLSGLNTYTGVTTISQGTLSASKITVSGGNSSLGNASSAVVLGAAGTSGTLSYTGAATTYTRGFTVNAGGGRVDNAGSGLLTIGTGGIATGGVFTVGGSADTTISSVISGAGSLVKTDAGTLTLSGANTYAGSTTFGGGTVAMSGNSSNLGTTPGSFTANSLIFSGGRLLATGTFSLTANRGLSLTAATTSNISATSGNTATFLGIIAGSGNITYGTASTGTGTVVVSGVNTYSGNTTVNAGTLRATTSASALGAGTLTLDGGTLQLANNTALTFGRNTTVTNDATLTADRLTSSTTGVTHTLGTLAIGSQTLSVTRGTNITGAGVGGITFGATTFSGDAALAVGGNALLTLGALSDGGVARTITNSGAGTLTLGTAAVSIVDGTAFNLTAGTVNSNQATALGTLANVTLSSGATLNLGASQTLGALNGAAGSVTLGANTLTVGSTNNLDSSFGGVVSGTGGLTKAGSGTVTLSGMNTYTGLTTVSAGTLVAQGSASLGATTGNVTVSAGTLALAGGAAVTLANPTNAETITKSGTLSLSGAGASGATGALVAVGATGQTSQWLGNITVSSAATIGAADNLLRIGDGASYANTLTLAGTLTLNTTSATGVTPVNLADNTAPYDQFDATNILINSQISGAGGITKTGAGTATIVSFPSNSFTGATVITGGKLIIDGSGSAPVISSTSVTVGNATGAGSANSVILQMGQTAGSLASVNDMIGTSSAATASTSMTVYSDGKFDLNGGSNSLINLTLEGGHVSGGNPAFNSLLTITGSVATNASAQTAVIDNGNLGMSSNSFAFNIATGSSLRVDSIVQNGVGFTAGTSATSLAKTGAGTLLLTAANTYAGVTDIQAGVLAIQNSAALGQNGSTAANGTKVAAGAQLQLDGSLGNLTIANESLTLNGNGTSATGELRNTSGNNTYNGFITLGGNSRINSDSGTLTIANTVGTGGSIINGDVAGRVMTVGGSGDIAINSVVGSNVGSIIKDGSGTVTLAGDYAANLTTSVNDGTLALAMVGSGPRGLSSATMVTIGDATGTAGSAVLLLSQSNQIADTAAVKLDTDGRLNVNGKTETVGSIASVTTTGTVGSILLGNGALSAGGANTSTIYAGTLAGAASSVFNKEGSGALTFSSNLDASPGDFAGTMNLNAGSIIFTASTDFTNNGLDTTDTLNVAAGTTLKLSDAVIKFANLNFTGTGTITLDFSGASSKLYSTNLNIAAGITLNIINWANAADFFYATNWTGAVLGTTGTGIENNVIFDAPTWTGANTKWQTYDHQITPVPEPSTYGAVLLGSMGALFGWRRIRSARPKKS